MIFNNPSDICGYYIKTAVSFGDTVIDATAGNGNDTLKLSNAVGEKGRVYSFDIQKEAIEAARKKEYKYKNVKFIHASHEEMDKYVKEKVKAVFFNLGYLPGGDHSIATKKESTIAAIKKSMSLIVPQGVIVLTIYRGGDSGFSEYNGVIDFLKKTDYRYFNVLLFDYANRPNNPPVAAVIQKKSVN